VADLFSTEAYVNRRHGDGVNVLYSDGSAKWLNRSVFVWSDSGGPPVDYLVKAQGLAESNNPVMDVLWASLYYHQ
jgi:prepilin-type processing-associated H-X9-DG protein